MGQWTKFTFRNHPIALHVQGVYTKEALAIHANIRNDEKNVQAYEHKDGTAILNKAYQLIQALGHYVEFVPSQVCSPDVCGWDEEVNLANKPRCNHRASHSGRCPVCHEYLQSGTLYSNPRLRA